MSLSQRIFLVLENNPKYSYNAYAVYDMVFGGKYPRNKKQVALVRTELNRLVSRGLVRKKVRGLFQIKPTPNVIAKLENPEIKIHGIKLEFNLENKYNTFGILGISPQNNITSFLESNRFNLVKKSNGVSLKRWSKGLLVLDRWVTVTVHEMGLVEVFCSCGDHPLSFSEFCSFCDFLSGYFNPVMIFKKDEVFVRQFALNRDFWELEMSGVSCVTLHKFRNSWASIYQHKDFVRMEHHLTLDVSLSDVIASLKLITPSVPVGVVRVNGDEFKDVV